MNTDLIKKTINDFEKDYSKLMNNEVFRKTVDIVGKQRYKTCDNREKKE